MGFWRKIFQKTSTWALTTIFICLLDVSVNWAEQILSLSQATEVALGFVELMRIVLKGDILYKKSEQGYNIDVKSKFIM